MASRTSTKIFLQELADLYKKVFPSRYNMRIQGKVIRCPLAYRKLLAEVASNSTALFPAHSDRAAWAIAPWKDERWFFGLEYKGIGYKRGPHIWREKEITLLGGYSTFGAIDEYNLNRRAEKAGILCQKAVAVYNLQKKFGRITAGMMVRSFSSPFRVSDLFYHRIFPAYLKLRYGYADAKSAGDYFSFLGRRVGEALRKMFAINMYHFSLVPINVSTEGEIADFEPKTCYEDGVIVTNRNEKEELLMKGRVLCLHRALEGFKELCQRIKINSFFEKSYFPQLLMSFGQGKLKKAYSTQNCWTLAGEILSDLYHRDVRVNVKWAKLSTGKVIEGGKTGVPLYRFDVAVN